MSPSFSMCDKPDLRTGYSESSSHGMLSHTRGQRSTYFTYCVRCKLSLAMLHAYSIPSLVVSVSIVVNLSSEEKVVWIDAPGIVAVVKDMQAIGNGSIVEFPRQSMNQVPLLLRPYQAVAANRKCPLPFPAVRTLQHPFPEALRGWAATQPGVVAREKAMRLPLHEATMGVCLVCQIGLLPTSTLAKTERNGRMRVHDEPPTQVCCAAPEGVISTARASLRLHYTTMRWFMRCLALPSGVGLTELQQARVIEAIRQRR